MSEENFGSFLRRMRLEKKLSQSQLGDLIGVTSKAISKWENNYTKPKGISVYKMSEVFSIDLATLAKRL